MLLKGSGMSNNNAATFLPLGALNRWCLGAILATASLVAAPSVSSASSPEFLEVPANVAVDPFDAASVRGAFDDLRLNPVVQPKPTVLASADLVGRLTNVLANGVQVMQAPGPGTLFVDFEKRGFGGVLVLRYRW
jgi:hypothetical protein